MPGDLVSHLNPGKPKLINEPQLLIDWNLSITNFILPPK